MNCPQDRFLLFPRYDSNKFYLFLIQVSYQLTGVPRCSSSKLANVMSLKSLPEHECQFYQSIKKPVQKYQVFYVVYASIFTIKSLYYTIYMICSMSTLIVNYNKQKQNLPDEFESLQAMSVSVFGCLVTNCTRIGSSKGLAQVLSELPLFSICEPTLNSYYMPLTDLGIMGLGGYTVFTYFIAIVAVGFVVRSYLYPSMLNSSAFPITPKYTSIILQEQARELFIELFVSIKNYCNDMTTRLEFMYRSRRLGSGNPNLEREYFMYKEKLRDPNYLVSEESSIRQLQVHCENLDLNMRTQLVDCTPLNRSECWTKKAAEDFCILWIIYYSTSLIGYALAIWLLIIIGRSSKAKLAMIDSLAQGEDCAFWINHSHKLSRILLSEVVDSNYWLYMVDYFLILVPTLHVLFVSVGMPLFSVLEVCFALAEQLNHLELAIKYCERLRDRNLDTAQTTGVELSAGEAAHNSASLHLARLLIMDDIWFPLKQPKRVKDSVLLKTVAELQSQSSASANLNSFNDLINKIYICNRLIKTMAQECANQVSTLLSFAYAGSYGAVLMITVINRRFDYSSLSPIAMAVLGLLVTNIIIVAISRVQSNTNKLIQMMWRLIAVTSTFTDIRIRHARRLLIKQVLVSSCEGTIRVTAFGLPVTSASLIEAVVWSSTIAIFSFNY